MGHEEQRRAPRTIIDVEAELTLQGQDSCPGVIRDLSTTGSLFTPDRLLAISGGDEGRFRFALPTANSWIEPSIHVRRVSTYRRLSGGEVQSVGFEFSGLTLIEERAIAGVSLVWSAHCLRDYRLSSRCFVQGSGDSAFFSRFGRLTVGNRLGVRVTFPQPCALAVGASIILKLGRLAVEARIEDVEADAGALTATATYSGWGRDFFLHEARRRSVNAEQDPQER